MARFSSATIALVVFWVSYAIVGVFVLYAALPPVNLKLVLILGGAEVVFVALALVALHRKRSARFDDKRA